MILGILSVTLFANLCVCVCDVQHKGLIFRTYTHILGSHLIKIYHAQQRQCVSPNCKLLHSADEVRSSAQSESLCENKYSVNKNLDNTIFSNCHFNLLLYFINCRCARVTPQRTCLQNHPHTLTKPIIN